MCVAALLLRRREGEGVYVACALGCHRPDCVAAVPTDGRPAAGPATRPVVMCGCPRVCACVRAPAALATATTAARNLSQHTQHSRRVDGEYSTCIY